MQMGNGEEDEGTRTFITNLIALKSAFGVGPFGYS